VVSPLHRADVARVLCDARIAQVAVETSNGPHVTPTAYGVADGRVWIVMARGTLKVRAIRRRPGVSLLMRAGRKSVVMTGEAEVISTWGRGDVARLLTNYLPSLFAVAAYTLRNSELLTGYLLDIPGAPGQTMPYDRVLVTVRAKRGMLIEGQRVVRSWGRWRGRAWAARASRPRGQGGLDFLLGRVPRVAATAFKNRGETALGSLSPNGPVVLPASALDGNSRVRVPLQALKLAGVPQTGKAALTADRSNSIRPSQFAGVVLRGEGTVVGHHNGWATVQLRADRASWWSGFKSGTVQAQETGGRGTRSSQR